MKKIHGLLALVLIAAAALAACGGGGGGGGGGAVPGGGGSTASGLGALINNPSPSPITAFTQNVVSKDTGTYSEIFPGMANLWTIEQDFSLNDGFDSQFHYAEALGVGGSFDSGSFVTAGTGTVFPGDQTYFDITFYTPYMHAADGAKVAAASNGVSMAGWLLKDFGLSLASVKAGTAAAFLNATSDSRLQQILDLTSVPTTTPVLTPVSIAWKDAAYLNSGLIPGYSPSPFYQVVIRDLDGNLLHTCYGGPTCPGTPCGAPTTGASVSHSGGTACRIDQFHGQQVVLSFEAASSNDPFTSAYAIIDQVSVTVTGHPGITITNGGFESGDLTGWTTNTPNEVQNITSGPRTLTVTGGPLTVTRSFYTAPSKLWGRWVDVFENTSGGTISTKAAYESWLGSDFAGSNGIIYNPVTGGAGNPKALTSWDSSYALEGDGTRDVGLVFGNADTVNFQSATTGLVAVGPSGVLSSPTAAGATSSLNGVAVDAVQFAAVGAGGVFLVSEDGVLWTSRTTNTTNALNGVASSTTGTFAAVGANGAFLTWDGTSPSLTPQPSGITTNLRGVASDGGVQFEAVGEGGAILLWDGSNFTPEASNTTAHLNGITWLGNNVVAVGAGGTIVVSSDGGQTFGLPIPGTGTNNLNGVVSNGSGTFVAVGAAGTVLTASAPFPAGLNTWSSQTSNTTSALNAITWDGSQFVAVGGSGTTLTSPDGVTWTKWTSGTADLKGVASDGVGIAGSPYIDVAYDIAVPANGGRVAIVNFVLMDGTDTGKQVGVINALATDIDTEAKNILNNFWTDPQYLTGMTQAQIDAVINMSH